MLPSNLVVLEMYDEIIFHITNFNNRHGTRVNKISEGVYVLSYNIILHYYVCCIPLYSLTFTEILKFLRHVINDIATL